jgi:hypothetical protein
MRSSPPPARSSPPDLFQPTLPRCLLAAGVAIASFYLPQEIPLEYYPLNNPSSGLQYLEITCAANVRSETNFYLNTGRGFNEFDKIQFPIGPSTMAYTYTFPLPDAPLFDLRLDPLLNGAGEFTITNFRIINRRNEEIRRFTPAQFYGAHQIKEIVPLKEGWKLVVSQSDDPHVQIRLDGPVIAEGMNERNLKRCLLSTGYLAVMLWIVLLAVFFAFLGNRTRRSALQAIAFLLFLAFCFSFVGNRGLIKNSVRYDRVAASVSSR